MHNDSPVIVVRTQQCVDSDPYLNYFKYRKKNDLLLLLWIDKQCIYSIYMYIIYTRIGCLCEHLMLFVCLSIALCYTFFAFVLFFCWSVVKKLSANDAELVAVVFYGDNRKKKNKFASIKEFNCWKISDQMFAISFLSFSLFGASDIGIRMYIIIILIALLFI